MMNESEIIEKITETKVMVEQHEKEIKGIKEDISDIKESNKALYKIATSVELTM